MRMFVTVGFLPFAIRPRILEKVELGTAISSTAVAAVIPDNSRVIENKTFVVGTGSLLAAWEGPSYDSEITLLKLARDIVRQLEGGAYATLGKFLSATLLEPDWNAQ